MVFSPQNNTRRGLAAVEMALLLPIFLMLLMGIMDTARLYWTQSVVRDAAFEGVRMAILHETTNEQIENTILEEIASGGISADTSVNIGPREARQPVEVTVSVPFEFFMIGTLIPSMKGVQPISATAVMTHER